MSARPRYTGQPASKDVTRAALLRRKRLPDHEHTLLTSANTEPVVSRELFERANAMQDVLRNPRGRPGGDTAYLLRGVVFCGECGYRLSPATAKGEMLSNGHRHTWRSYRCFSYKRHPGIHCQTAMGSQWIESQAWRLLEGAILDRGRMERLFEAELKRLELEDGTGGMAADLKRAEDRRKKVEQMVKKLVDSKLEADDVLLIKAYDEKLVDLGREAGELDRHVGAMRIRIEARSERRRVAESTLGLLDNLRDAVRRGISDPEEKRKYIEATGVRFRVWKDGHRVAFELPACLRCENLDASTR